MGKFSDKDIERAEGIKAKIFENAQELAERHGKWISELVDSNEPLSDESVHIAKQYYTQFHRCAVELGTEVSFEDFMTQMILMGHLDKASMQCDLKEQQDMIYDLSAEIEQLVELTEKLKED